jgi:D-alanine-D-alanine ligase
MKPKDIQPNSDEDPLSPGRAAARRRRLPRPQGLRIALLYNAKENAPKLADAPPDRYAELDTLDQVEAYAAALRSAGHTVYPLEGGPWLARDLARRQVDICFNTCEGLWGDSREAQVPALLEMLRVPYTAARVLGLAVTLDKAMTKRVLAYHGLPTPRFQEFHSADQPLDSALRFPLFCKPNREGTAMGISNKSIVRDEAALRERVAALLAAYHETVLVEEYVDGRDITCGLIGNLEDPNLPMPAGGIPSSTGHPGGPADWNGLHIFPLSEVDHTAYEPGRAPIYSHRLKVDLADSYHFTCPANVPEAIGNQIRRLTVETFRATQCNDLARVDFRLDTADDLKPCILEINALPGITPISDLTECARAEGWTYDQMINAVLDAAVKRHGLKPRARERAVVAGPVRRAARLEPVLTVPEPVA